MLLALIHHIAVVQLRTDDNLTDSHFPHLLVGGLRPTGEDSKFCFPCENLQLEKNPGASPNMNHIDQLLLQPKGDANLLGGFLKSFSPDYHSHVAWLQFQQAVFPLVTSSYPSTSHLDRTMTVAKYDVFIFLFFQISTTETSDPKLQ